MSTVFVLAVVVIGGAIALGAAVVRWLLRGLLNHWRRYA